MGFVHFYKSDKIVLKTIDFFGVWWYYINKPKGVTTL